MEIAEFEQGFGAEIKGFDLHRAGTPDDIAALRAAFDAHHLLVFRSEGALDPERHVEVAGWFGEVGANRDGEGRCWTLLDNTHATGSAVLPFHCDITFMERPFTGLSLHPRALPAKPTATWFVSNALGWEALSDKDRSLLRERKVLHRFHDHDMVGADWPELAFWHPARMPHPVTKRPLLFVTENHATRIEGMSAEQSAPLLERAFAALYAPERRYEHRWQAGDLLVWSNLAVQHARPASAEPEQGSRIMQRVALGPASFQQQLAERLAAA